MGTRSSTDLLPHPVTVRVKEDFGPYHAGQNLQVDRVIGSMAGPVKSNQFIPLMKLNEEDRAQINRMLTPANKT